MKAALHGIGVDVLHVGRIERILARHAERFVQRILCDAERRELETRGKSAARYLAKAFAAKEAFVKALGTGFVGVAHTDVGVVRADNGRPTLVISPHLQAVLDDAGVGEAHVSLTDERDLVCAFVVLEKR